MKLSVQVHHQHCCLLFRPDPASEGVEAVIGFSDVDGAVRVQAALLDDLLVHRPAVVDAAPCAFLGSVAHPVDARGDVVSDEMGLVADHVRERRRRAPQALDVAVRHHTERFS